MERFYESQWLTPADLGFKRANNYVTIYLELYDPKHNTSRTSKLYFRKKMMTTLKAD